MRKLTKCLRSIVVSFYLYRIVFLNLMIFCICMQILFVAGLSFVIGLERTVRFFFQRHKAKATSFFLGGIFVVLTGWPIIGVVLEIYGFFLLFRSGQRLIKRLTLAHTFPRLTLLMLRVYRGFFPVAVGFIRRVPVIGSLLSLPGIRTVSVTWEKRVQLKVGGDFQWSFYCLLSFSWWTKLVRATLWYNITLSTQKGDLSTIYHGFSS